MCELGKMPWFHIEGGRLSPESKKAADEVFLSLGGKVFFQAVEPMKAVRDVLLTSFAHSVPNECAFCKKTPVTLEVPAPRLGRALLRNDPICEEGARYGDYLARR